MRGDEPPKEGSADDRDEKDGLVTPLRPGIRYCHGRTDDGHQQPHNHKRQAHGTQRPSDPSGDAVAHPTDSSPLILFSCPFCHNPTLQHYRLQSVTTTVTRIVVWAKKHSTLEDSSTTSLSDICLCAHRTTPTSVDRGALSPESRKRSLVSLAIHDPEGEPRQRLLPGWATTSTRDNLNGGCPVGGGYQPSCLICDRLTLLAGQSRKTLRNFVTYRLTVVTRRVTLRS
jgi:hypothetical protein